MVALGAEVVAVTWRFEDLVPVDQFPWFTIFTQVVDQLEALTEPDFVAATGWTLHGASIASSTDRPLSGTSQPDRWPGDCDDSRGFVGAVPPGTEAAAVVEVVLVWGKLAPSFLSHSVMLAVPGGSGVQKLDEMPPQRQRVTRPVQ